MSKAVSVPKGTRDFSPTEMNQRNYLMEILKKHFCRFCFSPIETPSFENLSTLRGKYGNEGDKLIFKILNSGKYLKKVTDIDLQSKNYKIITSIISQKALRYDLTVPFARYVVQHQDKIVFPFKRYQMQPVWRADKPQKGRFREFYQCDADVVGSNSLWQEVEFIQLYDAVFSELGIEASIKINHRKILLGIAQIIGHQDKILDITTAIDKFDKIGQDKVEQEMLSKGISGEAIEKLVSLFQFKGNNTEKLQTLKSFLSDSDQGLKGVEEVEFILSSVEKLTFGKTSVNLEITLARGLNYYTGTIFEVQVKDLNLGSVGGGGRYDDLTGIFGLKGISGVGISFGLDRIYIAMKELGLFKKIDSTNIRVLFINFGEETMRYSMNLISELRNKGICVEMYPEPLKIKKQMTYAHKKEFDFVVMMGSDEYQNNRVTLKNMLIGKQESIKNEDLIQYICKNNIVS